MRRSNPIYSVPDPRIQRFEDPNPPDPLACLFQQQVGHFHFQKGGGIKLLIFQKINGPIMGITIVFYYYGYVHFEKFFGNGGISLLQFFKTSIFVGAITWLHSATPSSTRA